MARGGPFNTVKITQPKRNYFDLSYDKLYSCGFASLIPVCMQEALPGDKFRIRNQSVVRMQPLVAPVLSEIKLYTEYFFVPNRIIWDDWEKFIKPKKPGDSSPEVEYAHFTLAAGNYVTAARGSLADYLGLPVGYDEDIPDQRYPTWFIGGDTMGTNNIGGWLSKAQFEEISVLPFRAYQKVWNYFYRDEYLEDDIDADGEISQMSSSIEGNLIGLRDRAYHKDYFIGALPWPQLGVEPAVSLPQLPVVNGPYESWPTGLTQNSLYSTYHNNDTNVWGSSTSSTAPFTVTPGTRIGVGQLDNVFSPFVADTTSVGLTASDIRLLMQTQLFLERSARFGNRLNEFLLAHFGVSPRDNVLQEPEYIGGTRSNVIVSEVLQTSASSLSDTPLGTQGGRGLGVSDGYVGTYTASEHGFIVGLASIMPPRRLYEAQGVGKMWKRKSRYDYYFPEYAHLSEQPIYRSEIKQRYNFDGDVIFGYQPIYSEYRSNQSFCAGQMRHFVRDSLDYWSLGTYIGDGNVPYLNAAFITPSKTQLNKIFQIQDEDGFIVHFHQGLDAWRPMPSVGLPLSLVRF